LLVVIEVGCLLEHSPGALRWRPETAVVGSGSRVTDGSRIGFHFISDDRRVGGHLLDCSVANAAMGIDYLDRVMVRIPGSKEFGTAHIGARPQYARVIPEAVGGAAGEISAAIWARLQAASEWKARHYERRCGQD
jgi:hypothetical protein